jgi:glycosyltransferase involved in cell wall biosynthesis
VRIAIAYDCLYPYTIGGMERWYRGLAVALAERHEVTYLTRRQWGDREVPDVPKGVEVVALSSGGSLYTPSGRRDIRSPLRFGWGVARHLARHGRRYDVVHACAFPFFPAIAAALAERAGGPPVVTEWPEVWRRRSWRH